MRSPSRMPLHWPLRALLSLGLLALTGAAGAQDIAAAEALFDRGLADMKAGRHETGCKAIAESQRLDPRAGTLFTLATCEAEWGHIATAVTRYGDYLALYERLPDDKKAAQGERVKVATEQRTRLTPEVPRLTLSLPRTAPAGTVVKRNGEVVAEAALGVALPVDPGQYTVSVHAPNGPVVEQRITIGKGEKKQLTLEVKAVPTVDPGPLPPEAKPSLPYLGPIIAFGAAVVGLGVGVGTGAAVLGKRSELDEACPQRNCPVSEQGNLDGARTLSYVSTAAFVAAGIGAAAGAVLLVLPVLKGDKSKKVGIRLGAGYVGVEGTL